MFPPGELVPAALRHDDVHVWRAALDVEPRRMALLLPLLTPEERTRAARFRLARDRDRFIAGRARLRLLLGRYLAVPPAEIRFRLGPHGKPALEWPARRIDLRFNMSRSSGVALYALAVGREVGVDVERVTAADEQVAETAFAPAEMTTLRELPPSLRTDAFFACWTRKEAFVKARGDGLSFPLDRCEVSLAPHMPAALLAVRDDPAEAGRWSLHSLRPSDGYAAAVAVEGRGHGLSCRTWEE